MLQGHYASTLDFSNEALQAAEKGLDRMMSALEKLDSLPANAESDQADIDIAGIEKRCAEAMGDDFNTPILISVLFEAVKLINNISTGRISISSNQKERLIALVHGYTFEVLGLQMEVSATAESHDEEALMNLLVELRGKAKVNQDWDTADTIRKALAEMGITIMDGKDGSSWKRD
jgi:cysteinyl-tRNA synthetase